jgi:hypothetical protein
LISFSLILWEIINHKTPYHDINPDEVKTHVLKGMHPQPEKTNGTPIEYQKMMEKGWNISPKQRPTTVKMLNVLSELDKKEKISDYNIPRIKVVDNSKNFPSPNSASSEIFLSPISASSNNLLSPNSAIKDDDASSISSINTDCSADKDYISTAGLTATYHGMHKGLGRFNPFQQRTVDFEKAIKLHNDGNYSQAWEIIKEAKNNKTPDANFWVGYYYLKGLYKGHGGIPDASKGVEYLCQAAKEGHPDAQYHYAMSILNIGAIAAEHRNQKSFKIATELLNQAAQQDHSLALRKLGGIIARGKYGCKKDTAAGKEMIKRSRTMSLESRSSFETRPTNGLSRNKTFS